MEDLGHFLTTQGCLVRIPVLPGHDSKPEALVNVSYLDWFWAIEHEYREMVTKSQRFFAVGQSMGAALALHLAAHFRLDGVVALAPALSLPVWQQIGAFTLSPVLKWKSKTTGEDVNDVAARTRLQSYQSYPTASIKELIRTMHRVRKELPKIEAPLLIMHGRHDQTMSLKNVEILRHGVRSREIQIEILENSSHVITVDYDHEKVFAIVWNFVRRHSSFDKSMHLQKQME